MHLRIRHLVLPFCVLAAAGLVGGIPAAAPAQAADDVTYVPLAGPGAYARGIVSYWVNNNAANLIKATPYQPTVNVRSRGSEPTPDGPPGLVGENIKPTSPQRNVNLPRSTGKVFFLDIDGNPRWCNATAMLSHYKNVVATAGHCVYEPTSQTYHSYWVFIPCYYEGKAPFGIYVGKHAYAHSDFNAHRDSRRDYSFVTVHNGVDSNLSDVGRLGDNVGGQGLAYNQKIGDNVRVFGYASGPLPGGDLTGKTLKWTYGPSFGVVVWDVEKDRLGLPSILRAKKLVGVSSDLPGGGLSGAAWLLDYNHRTRTGYLNGLTVGVLDTDGDHWTDTVASSYFDSATHRVYQAAAALQSGAI
ncbi:trypsin-like serine peptidase [Microtetraspora malaysiensis]|uniref:trypsin-like serine peptidase n=1 Tax=Microtetraspora malaysiensis TaxID=161358 RepID=UPI003D91FCC1